MAPIKYIPGFISNPDEVFDTLWNGLDWVTRTPRRIEYWTNIYDRPYTYGSGVAARTYEAQPSHPVIEDVKAKLEPEVGFMYEACFLNGYADKRNGLEWHADDDPNIDHSRPIAVVTVGGGRDIEFMEIGDKTTKKRLFLEPGSLLLMLPGMQSTHLHRIPKAGFEAKPRISLTYRGLFA